MVMHGRIQWISHHCRPHRSRHTPLWRCGSTNWWILCTRVLGSSVWEYLLAAGACTSAAASQSLAPRVSEAVSPGQPHTPDLLLINLPKLFLPNIFCNYKLTEVDKSSQTEVGRCLQGLAKMTNVKVLLEISSSQSQSLFTVEIRQRSVSGPQVCSQ